MPLQWVGKFQEGEKKKERKKKKSILWEQKSELLSWKICRSLNVLVGGHELVSESVSLHNCY